MHEIRVKVPEGVGGEIAAVALSLGIEEASVVRVYVHGPNRPAEQVITHRLEGGGSVTDCKSCFRPEAGKMSPAPSGLQAVDGLNHLHGSLRLGSRSD